MKCPLLVYLQANLASLGSSERVVGEYVLANPDKVIHLSIADMRKQSGKCVDTIMGFCRQVGLKGYSDLKITLARELGQVHPANDPVHKNESPLRLILRLHAADIQKTLTMNSPETILRATQALAVAKHIELFSKGVCFAAAYMAFCEFQRMGFDASAMIDSHMQLVAATRLDKTDVAFGICSGIQPETAQCLKIARANGASTICLTNTKSTGRNSVDIVLSYMSSRKAYRNAWVDSNLTQYAVVDALFVLLGLWAGTVGGYDNVPMGRNRQAFAV